MLGKDGMLTPGKASTPLVQRLFPNYVSEPNYSDGLGLLEKKNSVGGRPKADNLAVIRL